MRKLVRNVKKNLLKSKTLTGLAEHIYQLLGKRCGGVVVKSKKKHLGVSSQNTLLKKKMKK